MKAYPCIGGPLDGQHATTGDFQGEFPKKDGRRDYKQPRLEGMYEHLEGEYAQYNFGFAPWRGKIPRQRPNMVWIHYTLLSPSIPPSKR